MCRRWGPDSKGHFSLCFYSSEVLNLQGFCTWQLHFKPLFFFFFFLRLGFSCTSSFLADLSGREWCAVSIPDSCLSWACGNTTFLSFHYGHGCSSDLFLCNGRTIHMMCIFHKTAHNSFHLPSSMFFSYLWQMSLVTWKTIY